MVPPEPSAPFVSHTHTVCSFIGSALPNSSDLASYAAKKYKPVARKVRPVATQLPERYRIVRNITGDPLERLPQLPTRPAPFEPVGRYTEERMRIIEGVHSDDFLWPEERKLMHRFMMLHEDGFAWEDAERGHFREDFFASA